MSIARGVVDISMAIAIGSGMRRVLIKFGLQRWRCVPLMGEHCYSTWFVMAANWEFAVHFRLLGLVFFVVLADFDQFEYGISWE